MNLTNSAAHRRSKLLLRHIGTVSVWRHSSRPQPVTHMYVYICIHTVRIISYLERRNCPLELDKCYLDEPNGFAVNICQIFSSYRSDQAGDNGTVVHCTAWQGVTRGTYGTAGFGRSGKERKTPVFETNWCLRWDNIKMAHRNIGRESLD